jgi:hypothetical protein
MNNIKKISIISLFLLMLVPTFTFAQTKLPEPDGAGTSENNPLVQCKNGVDNCSVQDGVNLIRSIIKLVFIFAGFIVAGMFMYAGFLLITSAGNPAQIQKAKDIFKRVVIGFLIMFVSYVLVKQLLTNIGAVKFFLDLIQTK